MTINNLPTNLTREQLFGAITFLISVGAIDNDQMFTRKGNEYVISTLDGSVWDVANTEAEAVEAYRTHLWDVYRKRSGTVAA